MSRSAWPHWRRTADQVPVELSQVIHEAAARLAAAGVTSPRVDAELLAGHVLDLSRSDVQTQVILGKTVAADEVDRFQSLVQERAQRVPLQHLTGTAPFRTLDLRVGPGVFIPRPETETVVELALAELHRRRDQGVKTPWVVDLGTGSGTIAASIAAEFPDAEVHAVELSEEAAAWAQLNFDNLPAGSAAVTLHRCDLRDFRQLFAPSGRISSPQGGAGRIDSATRRGSDVGFDLVVSNPPYIPPDMVPTEQEVRDHDPEMALYGGGADGLETPRAVIETALQILVHGGWLILEHAEVQAAALRTLCQETAELTDVATHQDLGGRDRATSARRIAEPHHADMTADGQPA